MFRYLSKKQWIILLISIILIIAAYFLIPISIPIILAFITALFLNPAVRLCQHRLKWKRKLSVIFVYITFLIILSVAGTFLITKAVSQIATFIDKAPSYVAQVEDFFSEWEEDTIQFKEQFPPQLVKQVENGFQSSLEQFKDSINEKSNLTEIAGFFSSIPNYLISFLIYLIALFLFMLDMPRLRAKAYEHMTVQTAEKVHFMNARLTYVVLGFLKAQFLVSIIIFIATLIGLLIIAPEVALIMSIIVWLIDFIPIIGSIAIIGPWSVYMFIVGDLFMGTQLAILAIVLLAIRRTVEPKVMGSHIGLSPLATLISMYLGLKIFGILGFFIGPLFVIAFNSAKEAGIIKLNFKI
ncbi:sporulation integral membrane protein YtvI [Pontibacillus litoralis]|uniref:Membrane protein n=1 Tax=Pontibacillus litoralis JSM 072002 TaxID=1385512 RepID=A0A0A5G979_9BACI|nr:sporulation integral membrane protein YtvI [Pontibacillus litoralis]KGX88574.1 membrane protein [Pontibacillus litoralis JSM 072002]